MVDLDKRALRYKIENLSALPTLPSVLKRVIGLVENPKTSLSDIGAFISKDPALTTRVLKMVNSPVYGFPGKISSVSQALVLLGLNVTKGLLIGVSVFDLMRKSMVGLWEHSLACALTSTIISKTLGIGDPEEVSVSALLHDVGKVALAMEIPDEYQRLMEECKNNGLTIYEVEYEKLNFTHSQAGGWMTRKWNFPPTIVDVIEYHHRPNLAKVVPDYCSIVNLADCLVRARGIGFAGDEWVPPVDPNAFERLAMTEDKILEILSSLEESLEEVEGVFE